MTESQVSWITCLSCRQTNIQNLKRSKCPRKKSPTSKRHQLLSWLLASFLHKELLSLPLLLPIRQHAPFPQLHSSLSFRHKRRHKTSQAHIWLSLFSLLSVYCQIIQLANTMYQSYTKGQLITGRFCCQNMLWQQKARLRYSLSLSLISTLDLCGITPLFIVFLRRANIKITPDFGAL